MPLSNSLRHAARTGLATCLSHILYDMPLSNSLRHAARTGVATCRSHFLYNMPLAQALPQSCRSHILYGMPSHRPYYMPFSHSLRHTVAQALPYAVGPMPPYTRDIQL
ncbi:hypothetical protein PoB_001374200 [Plakobranchus ocellatus]|uniref:Uncharacterized protein n=1 Tax=Plakobranchus ocellatus TaxID=259542 RepID=A0AAV3YY23_9GAST|nr:hypothetical protein PoB_001374200 [Plakobranchus ocellatus]